jgi:hypothetical protein
MPAVDPSANVSEAGRMRGRESLREVVVVSLGILIAFSIDASWDGRQERVATERLMSAVAEELVLNAGVLERTSRSHGERARAGLEILNLTGPEADSAAAAAAVSFVTAFWHTPRAELSSSALSAALELGTIGSVSDVELREVLAGLPREYSILDGVEGEISRVMREHIFPRLWTRVPQMNFEIESGFGDGPLREEFSAAVPDQSRFSTDLRGLLRDLTFENAVVERTTLLMIARDRSGSLAAGLRAYAADLEGLDDR